MLAAIILAAGESRRMGEPKALLPFPKLPGRSEPATKAISAHAETFLEHLLEVTRHTRVGTVRVVVGAHEKEICARICLPAGCIVMNREWERGQLSSLQAAIRSLPVEKTEGVIVCLVDHPLISERLVSQLIETFDKARGKIVLPTFHGRKGHPVIFPSTLLNELLAASADVGARAVVRAHVQDVIELPTEEEGVVLNLNDRVAIERARGHFTAI